MNDRLIMNIQFSENVWMNNSIQNLLNDHNYKSIDDLSKVKHWELLKIQTMGIKKLILIEDVMKAMDVKFQDRKWLAKIHKLRMRKT